MKMLFHFIRVEAQDIAFDERMKEASPKKFTSEVVE